MKRIVIFLLVTAIAAACAAPPKKQSRPDYEGQRERARQEFKELDKE